MALGLLTGQAGHAGAVFDSLQGNFHLITDGDFEFSILIHELAFGDNAF